MNMKEKKEQHGFAMGRDMTILACVFAGVFGWIVVQAASGALLFGFMILFALMFGDMLTSSGSSGPRVLRSLWIVRDTRERVLAQEDYHGIEYHELPRTRRYVQRGQHLTADIKEVDDASGSVVSEVVPRN